MYCCIEESYSCYQKVHLLITTVLRRSSALVLSPPPVEGSDALAAGFEGLVDGDLACIQRPDDFWESASVAQITSQSAVGCYVKGVSTGTATISCKYRYYIAGTYITSYYHCYVEVASSGGSSGGGGSHYVTMTCDHSDLTLDLAKPEAQYRLFFYTKGNGQSKIHLSMDVRSGWPQYVSFDYSLLSENGSPVIIYCTYPSNQRENISTSWTLHPKKLGGEIITFQLVHEKDGRYYNTGFQTVDIPVTVICSHKYDGGILIQPATYTQNEIREYTCSICGEKTGTGYQP